MLDILGRRYTWPLIFLMGLWAVMFGAVYSIYHYYGDRDGFGLAELGVQSHLIDGEVRQASILLKLLHSQLNQVAATTIIPANVNSLVNSLQSQPSILAVSVFDRSGRVLLPLDGAGQNLSHQLSNFLPRGATLVGSQAAVITTDQYVLMTQPLAASEKLGGVAVVYSLLSAHRDGAKIEAVAGDFLATQRRQDSAVVVVLLAAGSLFASLVVILLSRRFFISLDEMNRYALAVSKGDFTVPLKAPLGADWLPLSQTVKMMASQIVQQREEAKQQVFRDDLTRLPNRRGFKQYLNKLILFSAHHRSEFSLLIIDLDNFKRVNDSLNHEAGDELLAAIAERMRNALNASALASKYYLARIGGDEFAVVLPGIGGSHRAAGVAKLSLDLLKSSYISPDHDICLGASVGISRYPQDGEGAAQLLKNADIAMYQAKDSGRGRYQFFDRGMSARAMRRINVEIELHQALALGELKLYYQPKFDMNTRMMVGSEALLRWQHAQRGLIGPEYLMTVAEESGLIGPIGCWVSRQVCQQLALWKGTPLGELPIAINVSAAEFELRQVAADLRLSLEEFGVEAELVQIEVTETVLVSNEERVGRELELLRNMGVKIWIDDFGTGYSSLGYLRRFSVDGLKIDRSFVGDLSGESNEDSLCSAIVAMASQLNLDVVAEGVETIEQYRHLQAANCIVGQGYFYARPMLAEVLERQTNYFLQLIDSERIVDGRSPIGA